ncbi:Ca2-binding protein [Aureococcus anophagefferens]|nr:Ca2-binding protein [Aureococcus anophagefferens]
MPEVDHEQEAIDELRAAFAIFDKEGKGFVEIRECKSLFYTLGIKITKSAIREMIEKDGKDGQNSLDFNEFSGLAMPLFKKRARRRRRRFRLWTSSPRTRSRSRI